MTVKTKIVCYARKKKQCRSLQRVLGHFHPRYQGFFLTPGGRDYYSSLRGAEGRLHERRSREKKTSGTERFHSMFSLTFDQFYRITFKPMTVSISLWSRGLAREDMTHSRDMTDVDVLFAQITIQTWPTPETAQEKPLAPGVGHFWTLKEFEICATLYRTLFLSATKLIFSVQNSKRTSKGHHPLP